MSKSDFRILVFGIVAAILVVGLLFAYQWPVMQTEALVIKEAKIFLQNGGEREPAVDLWGHPLEYQYQTDNTRRVALVTSAGRDGVMDTPDDIVAQSTDLNKSKIVGRWFGQKSKEFAKGFKSGLKDKSDFAE